MRQKEPYASIICQCYEMYSLGRASVAEITHYANIDGIKDTKRFLDTYQHDASHLGKSVLLWRNENQTRTYAACNRNDLMGENALMYNHYSNFYITPEVGIIANISDETKIMASYEHYLNTRGNNRGYNGKYNLYIGRELIRNIDLYTDYSYYINSNYKHDFTIGLSYMF